MDPATVHTFERTLNAVIAEGYSRRLRGLPARGVSAKAARVRAWGNAGAMLSGSVVGALVLFAPLWAPFAHSRELIPLLVVGAVFGIGIVVYALAEVDQARARHRIYPMPVLYDWCASELVIRCGRAGIKKEDVKYLFASSKTDRSFYTKAFETVWKYGGGTAFGVAIGAKGPPWLKVPIAVLSFGAALFLLTHIVDPVLRRSQLADAVDRHCK